jgi:hypothetical protein
MSRNTRIILAGIGSIIILVAVGGLFAYTSYKNSLQNVVITFDTKYATLNLYKSKSEAHPTEKQDSALRTITSGETFTLAPGSYVIEASGTNVKANPINIVVGNTPTTQTIPISYTDAYLDQQLTQNHEAIVQAISTGLASTMSSLYTVEPGKVYGYGDWYGTTLVYKGSDTNNRDSLHILLHKQDGRWSMSTKTPAITLSAQEYKEVPSYILRDVNRNKSEPSDPPAIPAPDYVIDDGSPGAQ